MGQMMEGWEGYLQEHQSGGARAGPLFGSVREP